MAGELEFRLIGNEKSLIDALNRAVKKQQEAEVKYRDLAREAKAASAAGQQGAQSQAAGLTKITGAANQAATAVDRLGKESIETGNESKTAADVQRRALRQVETALGKVLRDQEKQRGSVQQVATTQQQSVPVLSSIVGKIGAAATGWLSVGAAIRAANDVLEKHNQLNEDARQAQVTVGESQALVVQNLTGVETTKQKQFLDDIKQIQEDTGFKDVSQLNMAAASGVSASSGDLIGTLDALRQAARFNVLTPNQLETMVGGALDIRKASGVEDARQNLGFLATAGAQARITSPEKQARNIAPAVISGAGTIAEGQDQQRAAIESAAIFAALSNMAGDVTGESSRTATQLFTNSMREFFQGTGRFEKSTMLPSTKLIQDPGTIQGRMSAISSMPELRDEFLRGMGGEQAFKVPFEQLITGGDTAKIYEAAAQSISFSANAFEDNINNLANASNEMRKAASDAARFQRKQTLELRRTDEANIADIRKELEDTIRQVNTVPGEEFITLKNFDARASDTQEAGALATQFLRNFQTSQRWGMPGVKKDEASRDRVQQAIDAIASIQRTATTSGLTGEEREIVSGAISKALAKFDQRSSGNKPSTTAVRQQELRLLSSLDNPNALPTIVNKLEQIRDSLSIGNRPIDKIAEESRQQEITRQIEIIKTIQAQRANPVGPRVEQPVTMQPRKQPAMEAVTLTPQQRLEKLDEHIRTLEVREKQQDRFGPVTPEQLELGHLRQEMIDLRREIRGQPPLFKNRQGQPQPQPQQLAAAPDNNRGEQLLGELVRGVNQLVDQGKPRQQQNNNRVPLRPTLANPGKDM